MAEVIPFNPELPEHRAPRVLIEYIRTDDPAALDYFAREFTARIRPHLRRMMRADPDDLLHDVYLEALKGIRAGQVRDAGALWGFCTGIGRRLVARWIRDRVKQRRRAVSIDEAHECSRDQFAADRKRNVIPIDGAANPEQALIRASRIDRVRAALKQLSPRHREIIERFYFYGQAHAEIEREMGITGTQFRLAKSRALERLVIEIGKIERRRRLRRFEPMGMAA